MFNKNSNQNKAGHWVYAAYVIRDGRIIRPKKGKVLRFFVADKAA